MINTRLEKSKINWDAAYGVSEQVFTQAACDILGLPIERIEVRRCIQMGSQWGRLTVYVYKENDERKAYYDLTNGAMWYTNLSPNIHKFKTELAEKIKTNTWI